ncbi:DNA-binding transcriptional regulator, MarR family [Rhodoblastus acidophilus]|uniref:DNA-binding transcriptional regulator, MarR family n=2 Tax=Rhodoblastus acidophilus TaxID=1074 RepID=A0A212QZD5_RHOAC|nr:MarR family transcriptional regulator [Rhodoblastus acidophilus]PPQ40542.1 MarR family transcriptional regulator [Rhodoblastus acidophilus]SNB65056.1 DNA-binding transcriptional regulator, MarR family [Rhodoblastus acidophilus]
MADARVGRLASQHRDAAEPPPVSYGVLGRLLGFHLRRSQTAVAAHVMDRVNPEDAITPGLFGALEVIAANEGLAQSDLAKAMGVDRSSIVKAIDQLEARSLIQRLPSDRDRRRHRLCLTPAGRATCARLRERFLAQEAVFLQARLSAEEVETLMGLLERLHGAADPACLA